jgi:hypothetical protein
MAEKELTIKIELPPVITVRVWDEYAAGVQAYWKTNPGGSVRMSCYAGSLALLKAQLVNIEAPDDFMKYLNADKHDNTPLAVVGLITREISDKVDAALNAPLGLKVIS